MNKTTRYLLAAGIFALIVAGLPGVENTEDVRLRETLRSTLLQLRNAQADLASAQAAQTSFADEKKTLGDQIALLKKHITEGQAIADKKIAEQKATVAEQTEQIARLNQALEEMRAKYEKEAENAKTSETKRTQLFSDSITLERQLADLRAKNTALYRLGKEILTRYEKVGLGQQFLAREPFVGRTRVELENLIQEFDDKLAEHRAVKP